MWVWVQCIERNAATATHINRTKCMQLSAQLSVRFSTAVIFVTQPARATVAVTLQREQTSFECLEMELFGRVHAARPISCN